MNCGNRGNLFLIWWS